MAGAPKGNKNAAKGKMWAAAIDRALAKRSRKDGLDALDALAERFLKLCDERDLGAFKELGDRIDGKVAQVVQGPGPEGESKLIVEIVRFGSDQASE